MDAHGEPELILPPRARRRVRIWLTDTFHSGDQERFRELALEDVDRSFASPATWIAGGLAAWREAVSLRDASGFPLAVALTWPLADERSETAGWGNAEGFLGDVEGRPTLAAYSEEQDFWSTGDATPFDGAKSGLPSPLDGRWLLLAWRMDDEDPYHRTAFLLSPPSPTREDA